MTEWSIEFVTFRSERQFTQRELAKKLGVSLRTVQGIEQGEHGPSFMTRVRFQSLRRNLTQSGSDMEAK